MSLNLLTRWNQLWVVVHDIIIIAYSFFVSLLSKHTWYPLYLPLNYDNNHSAKWLHLELWLEPNFNIILKHWCCLALDWQSGSNAWQHASWNKTFLPSPVEGSNHKREPHIFFLRFRITKSNIVPVVHFETSAAFISYCSIIWPLTQWVVKKQQLKLTSMYLGTGKHENKQEEGSKMLFLETLPWPQIRPQTNMNTMQKTFLPVAFGSIDENTMWHLKCERVNNGSSYLKTESESIRVFNGLEKGTCAPNNHEHAFVQRGETKD